MTQPTQDGWPGGIAAITLFVEDLDGSRRFYQEVFGLEVVYEDEHSAVFPFGGTLVNLLTVTEAPTLSLRRRLRRPMEESASSSPWASTTSTPRAWSSSGAVSSCSTARSTDPGGSGRPASAIRVATSGRSPTSHVAAAAAPFSGIAQSRRVRSPAHASVGLVLPAQHVRPTRLSSRAGGPRTGYGAVMNEPARVARLQNGEDADRGREARKNAPRASHGDWEPSPARPDPVRTLHLQAESRVPELVPIRYGRMLVSPFTFFRGAAAVMAADLAETPSSGLVVQACGDAHISNFGGFAAPDRRLVFGPNDFDETLPGPWEWDVKRMAASIEIAGRDIELPARAASADRRARRPRVPRGDARVRRRRAMLDAWYERLDADELTARFGTRLDAEGQELFDRTFAKGAAQDQRTRRRAS